MSGKIYSTVLSSKVRTMPLADSYKDTQARSLAQVQARPLTEIQDNQHRYRQPPTAIQARSPTAM